MSAAEIDRVTALARLMRQAYPSRSELDCIARAAEILGDIGRASVERSLARDCRASIVHRLNDLLAVGPSAAAAFAPLLVRRDALDAVDRACTETIDRVCAEATEARRVA